MRSRHNDVSSEVAEWARGDYTQQASERRRPTIAERRAKGEKKLCASSRAGRRYLGRPPLGACLGNPSPE